MILRVQQEMTNAAVVAVPVRRRILRWLINGVLCFHLMAIVTAPLTVGPSSQIARNTWDLVNPWLQFLYLNHGFHYFAPEPSSSNLVDYKATGANGETVSGRFPNFDIQPRLLYHRYFMLSEFMGNSPPDMRERIAAGYCQCLCEREDADIVELKVVRHHIPSMVRMRVGGTLLDEDLFETVDRVTYERE